MVKVSWSGACLSVHSSLVSLVSDLTSCFITLGGTFALYSLLCRHAKFNLLPNQQAADEELAAYKYGHLTPNLPASPLKLFLERHKKTRTALLLLVLFGAGMVIGDGVLTPAISGADIEFVARLN